MPKVLRIINRFNLGGPTYNVSYLSKYMDDRFETMLVGGVPDESETDSLFIPKSLGLEPKILPELKREISFKDDRIAYKKLIDIIHEFKPDIVHTHASKAGTLGRLAAKKCNVPIIVHTFHGHVFHSYFGNLKTNLYKTIERRLAKKSTGIIAISNEQKRELVEDHSICPKAKVKVINLGFDLDRFHESISNRELLREKFGIKEGEVAIGIVGRLAPIKNHELFLSAIEIVLEKTSQKLKVFIVGDGELFGPIEERVTIINKKYPGVIKMTSWIRKIEEFNPAMDIICLSSDNEGTPVSLIEAQATNIPVISTNVGGVKDILIEGETGIIVPKNNVDAYSKALLDLVENKKKREKMSQNGWNHVKEKFHYHTLAKNMENYYDELLRNK